MLLVAFMALAAGVLVQSVMRDGAVNNASPKLTDFSFPDAADHVQAISQWQGKVLVINFWATWCPPCLQEIPEFIKLQAEYQHLGLQFVGVAIDDKQSVAAYLQGININYPILIAGDEGIGVSKQFGNILNAVPYTVIVNRLGQVIHRLPGEISREKLVELVTPLIN